MAKACVWNTAGPPCHPGRSRGTGNNMRTMHFISACLTAVVSAALFSCAGVGADTVPLDGAWKVIAGDDVRFASAGFDDGAWGATALPGSLTQLLLARDGSPVGVVWARKHFRGTWEWAERGAGLSLGMPGNADQAFVNGVLVGSTGGFPPHDVAQWNRPRHYRVPPGIIRDGDNVIALRMACSLFCQSRGHLEVSGIGAWERARDVSFFFQMLNYAGMAVCGAIGLVFLLVYIRRPDWAEYRYFLLQLVPGFFVVYEICGAVPIVDDTILRVKLMGFMWTLLVVFHLGFLHRLYALARPKAEAALWLLLAINTALLAWAHDVTRHRWVALFVIVTVTPTALYNLTVHLTALRRGNAHARILVVPGAVLSLGATHDGIVYLSWALGRDITLLSYRFDSIIFGYCAAMMFLGAALILVHRFMNALDESEDLNRNLEARVGERTAELTRSLRELSTMVDAMHLDQRVRGTGAGRNSISSSTEEKIKKAVVYIHENYMFDISREGLAALVGLNHDHLGKAFRIYTGKKVQDYINELRVKSAAVMLRETDRKIIDIAFDSGFESLRTFNRAFKSVVKTSPVLYRKHGGGEAGGLP